jgi:hypothetical protein
MKQSLWPRILLAIGSALVCLAIAEVGVRLGGRTDADGDFYFHETRVKPFHVPVRAAQRLADEYNASKTSVVIYDPKLGWMPRPGVDGANEGGFYSSAPKLDDTPPPDCVRIALFGGSFTQNSFEKGWWRALEKNLKAAGVKVEILNFGCGAYGMDQAYLRWKTQGVKYHPNIVIFGFVAANARDNVNLLRLLQNNTSGIPFAKPRFIIENGALKLIGAPTPRPEEVPRVLASLGDWPLLRYERFYDPADYTMRWWRHSRLLAYAESKLQSVKTQKADAELYRMDGEPAQVSLKIVEQFKREAEAEGSAFYMLHLPTAHDVEGLQLIHTFPFADLFAAVNKAGPVIQPEQAIVEAANRDGLPRYFKAGHYTEEAYEIVGAVASDYLLNHAIPASQRGAEMKPRPAQTPNP